MSPFYRGINWGWLCSQQGAELGYEFRALALNFITPQFLAVSTEAWPSNLPWTAAGFDLYMQNFLLPAPAPSGLGRTFSETCSGSTRSSFVVSEFVRKKYWVSFPRERNIPTICGKPVGTNPPGRRGTGGSQGKMRPSGSTAKSLRSP